MNSKPYSVIALSVSGLLLAAIGLYFIFLRPPLLPEDLRYMDLSLQDIKNNIPGLLNWLQKVFWVLGGYIFATGVLTVYVSVTSFRTRLRAPFIIVSVAGASSIGLMTIANFMIGSDFKWVLFSLAMLWTTSLIFYRFQK